MKNSILMVAGIAATLAITSCGGSKSGITDHQLMYEFIKGAPAKTLVAGDVVEFDMIFKIGDSVLTDSKKDNNNEAIKFPLPEFDSAAPYSTGLPLEGVYMLNTGDSAIFKVLPKVFFESVKQPMPEWIKETDTFKWEVGVIKVVTAADFAKENEKLRVKSDDFAKTKSGIQYKIIELGKGGYAAKVGDILEMNIEYAIGDSIVFNSLVSNNGMPVSQAVTMPQSAVDIMEAIAILQEGDSAVIRITMAEFLAGTQMQKQPWMNDSDNHEWRVKMVAVKSAEEKKAAEEKAKNDKTAQDAAAIQEYIKANGIQNVKTTASGLHYAITQEGTGATPTKGQNVSVNYTGKLLDGKVFDSSVDPKFQHPEPLVFPVGGGRVIAGWDEGFMLLNKGSKATLIIPSGLAYGDKAMGADIPANSILVFDVELLEIN